MWTKEPPTKEGYYWFMDDKTGKVEPVKVDFCPVSKSFQGWIIGSDYPYGFMPDRGYWRGLWHPATPPALPITEGEGLE